MKLPKRKLIRTLTALIPLAIVVVGLATNLAPGTLSSFGIGSIALVCPLGSLETMLASKSFIPQALISLICLAAICALLGKVFCDWVCPVPLWQKAKDFLLGAKRAARPKEPAQDSNQAPCHNEQTDANPAAPLSEPHSSGFTRPKIDSRFAVLVGSCASAALFGFPVFCLICPVGLTFGLVIALWRLFGFQEATILLVVIPLFVVLEVLVLRKWCSKICPLGALLALFSSANRLFRPHVDAGKCLRLAGDGKGVDCTVCRSSCRHGIDLHHAAKSAPLTECTKCGDCADECPASAISFPLLPEETPATRKKRGVSHPR